MTSVAAGRVDSKGRPVFIATVAEIFGPCFGHSAVGWLPKAVVRLTAAGELDQQFGGGDGSTSLDSGPDQHPDLAIEEADEPVIEHWGSCEGDLTLHRLDANGEPITGFGSEGMRVYRQRAGKLAVGLSGAMLILQEGDPWHVIRIDADGTRDTGFGRDGRATVTMPAGATRTLGAIAIDSRGGILLAGSFHSFHSKEHRGHRGRLHSFIVVTRLLPSGKLDRGFGRSGRIVSRFGRRTEPTADEAGIDSQGRLVVAGTATTPRLRRGGFVLARYLLRN
jgi:uncharacterized delta-60 repeat protein